MGVHMDFTVLHRERRQLQCYGSTIGTMGLFSIMDQKKQGSGAVGLEFDSCGPEGQKSLKDDRWETLRLIKPKVLLLV